MALIECKHCGITVSDKARICPHCGEEMAEISPTIVQEQCNNKDETVARTNDETSEERPIEEEWIEKQVSVSGAEQEPIIMGRAMKENIKITEITEGSSIWSKLSIVSFLCSLFTFYKGIDRMTNYYNSENYFSKNVNAWVGGDAYNYIINGTHATAFFVLTTMFVLAAIGLMIVHYVSRKKAYFVTNQIE